MKAFVVSIPVFDEKLSVQAYKLCDRDGDRLFGSKDDYREVEQFFISPGLDLIGTMGIDPFALDKPLMLDINEYQLLMGFPTKLNVSPERLICNLPNGILADESTLQKCEILRGMGYSIALDGIPEITSGNPIMDIADYITLDYSDFKFDEQVRRMVPYFRKKKMIISNIPDMETFERINNVPGALYTGSFYSKPLTKGVSSSAPLKINIIRLLNEVNNEDVDLISIADTIGMDPALSLSLLRFINSPAVGITQKITSIRSAVTILGQKEVRRWAAVSVSVKLMEDQPGEITHLSLVRAKFAENLAPAFGLTQKSSTLFIAGLMSLIDAILQKPMEEAIREISVDDDVRQALVSKKGPVYDVLELVYAYEKANWDAASVCMIKHDIDVETVSDAFVDALTWYTQIFKE